VQLPSFNGNLFSCVNLQGSSLVRYLICLSKIRSSNIDHSTRYTNRGFRRFPQMLKANFEMLLSSIGHDRYFSHPFQPDFHFVLIYTTTVASSQCCDAAQCCGSTPMFHAEDGARMDPRNAGTPP